jgi:hypothetical protein
VINSRRRNNKKQVLRHETSNKHKLPGTCGTY